MKKLAERFGNIMRMRRAKVLKEIIEQVQRAKGQVAILDVGGTEGYWNAVTRTFLRENKVHVTLLNIKATPAVSDPDIFTAQVGNGCSMPQFNASQFDLVHSNSVIEHVGTWENMKSFALEVARVGRHYFVQTPSFWFPIEPHFHFPFFHWLPFPARVWMLARFGLGWHKVAKDLDEAVLKSNHANLLTKPLLSWLFPDAVIKRERFLALTKSYIAVRNC